MQSSALQSCIAFATRLFAYSRELELLSAQILLSPNASDRAIFAYDPLALQKPVHHKGVNVTELCVTEGLR